ncbi:MAG: hypothetical protein EBT13_15365, partial [Rhodobacteraceae bacterium]|nr:hypothetical protein [Paracoccaceae bacterium]
MAISIDWGTKVITVPKADMLVIQVSPSEIRQLDIDAFRLELKDLEDSELGMAYPITHNHVAPITVGGVTLARVVEIINGYTVTFEDDQYAVNLVGANSNIADVTNVNQVSVRSANSAGLTFSEQINSQSFIDAAVTLDVNDGMSGTQFPRGTPTDPVDNLTDALAIAAARGLHKIYLTGFVTATASHDLSGITVVGGSGASNVLLLSGADTTNAGFERLVVVGQQNGLARIRNCILGATGLGAFTGSEGRFVDCVINTAAGVTQNASGVGTLFDNCAFVAPNDPQITIDANGKGFGLRNCTGNILITNQTVNEQLQVHITGARVEVSA